MRKSLALPIIITAVTASCGGKELDIGGGRGGPWIDPKGVDAAVDTNDGAEPPKTNSTAIITHQRTASSLFLEGAFLYWSTYDERIGSGAMEVWRCDKIDCRASQRMVLRHEAPLSLGFIVRNGRIYWGANGGITSCSADDCSAPKIVIAPASGGAVVTDDANIFWGASPDNAFLMCPLDGCAQASLILAGVGYVTGLAAGAKQLEWFTMDSLSMAGQWSLSAVPKDGSGPAQKLAKLEANPYMLFERGEFIYWSELEEEGRIVRCRTTGCPDGPEALAAHQFYPHELTLEGDRLFWIEETKPPNVIIRNQGPTKVISCLLSDCANTVTTIDHVTAGAVFAPRRYYQGAKLVADSDNVYYIGDANDLGPPDAWDIVFEASIRRLPRTQL